MDFSTLAGTVALRYAHTTSKISENLPKDPKLWEQVIEVTKGERKSLTRGDVTYEAPNEGKGFKKFPSAYANGFAVQRYEELGGTWRTAAKPGPDPDKGDGLNTWFSGHGKSDGEAKGGDWVAISPKHKTVTKEDGTSRKVEPGDILGPCGDPVGDWDTETKGGDDPLKCLNKDKAHRLTKQERADLAKEKLQQEKSAPNTKTPTYTKNSEKSTDMNLKSLSEAVALRYAATLSEDSISVKKVRTQIQVLNGERETLGKLIEKLEDQGRDASRERKKYDALMQEVHINERLLHGWGLPIQKTSGKNDAAFFGVDPTKLTREEQMAIVEERPWLHPDMPDAMTYVWKALRAPLIRWQVLVEDKSKVFAAWKAMHPDLKEALDEANYQAIGGRANLIGYRSTGMPGKWPQQTKGISLHVELEPQQAQLGTKYNKAYSVYHGDILIHPDVPNNPMNEGMYRWEREMILKPTSRPKELREGQTESLLKKISRR
jgi:hypothetical protein